MTSEKTVGGSVVGGQDGVDAVRRGVPVERGARGAGIVWHAAFGPMPGPVAVADDSLAHAYAWVMQDAATATGAVAVLALRGRSAPAAPGWHQFSRACAERASDMASAAGVAGIGRIDRVSSYEASQEAMAAGVARIDVWWNDDCRAPTIVVLQAAR